MSGIEGDRRQHPRIPLQRACKMYDPRAGQYISGNTRNVSAHGLMIEIDRLTGLKPGERVYLGVAITRRHALLRASEMVEAEVSRVLETADHHTHLALKKCRPPFMSEDECLRLAA